MRGRKPKPVELKLVEGTFRKDRAPSAPPPAARQGTPHCPEWFDDEQRGEWKKLARHYRDQGRSIQPHEVGIHVDYVVLTVQLAQHHRQLAAVEAEIRKKGEQLGLPGLDAARAHAPEGLAEQRKDLLREIRRTIQDRKSVAAELGLTPSARSRAGWGTPAPKAEAEADPWGELAKGAR